MARNPLTYTFRTFETIESDLKSLYPNAPSWLTTMIAGLFDILHWYLDARAQNLILSSTFTEQALYDITSMLDYYISGPSPAQGQLNVTLNTSSGTILKDDLIFNITTTGGETIRFEGVNDFIVTSGGSGIVDVIQGETKSNIIIGQSDGSTKWQEFVLPDTDVLVDTISIEVNSQVYTQVNSLVNSFSTDRHYRVLRKSDGAVAVMFGDGEYGAVPPSYDIVVSYRIGGGIEGNVKQSSTVDYLGGSTLIDPTVPITLVSDFTGGNFAENLERARFLAPQFIGLIDRAVAETDYELLAIKFMTGVLQVKAFPGLYGGGTVGVHVIPTGGGNPTVTMKQSIQDYLKDRSTLRLVDVRVRNPLYQSQDISIEVKPRSGYVFSQIVDYCKLACLFLISEVGKQIIDEYDQNGIASAVSLINSVYGFTFTTVDNEEIQNILIRVKRDGYVTWGKGLVPNDIVSIVDSITGVDTLNVLYPTTTVTLSGTRVFQAGTVTVTEIV